jgi:FkbM family methyltransferase
LRYGDLAFDIGANKGLHTDAMVRRGARVVAVEPQPEMVARLEQIPNVTVVKAAVAENAGEMALHTSSSNDHYATLSEQWVHVGQVEFEGSMPVEVTTLDHLIARYGVPALAKIDVEGFEDRVFAGLSTPIRHVLFEMHRSLIDVAERALARLEALGSYEYRLLPHEESELGHDPWVLGPVITPAEILAGPWEWTDIYACHTQNNPGRLERSR